MHRPTSRQRFAACFNFKPPPHRLTPGRGWEVTAGIDALHSRRVVCDVRWHLANITMAPIRINAFPVHDVIDWTMLALERRRLHGPGLLSKALLQYGHRNHLTCLLWRNREQKFMKNVIRVFKMSFLCKMHIVMIAYQRAQALLFRAYVRVHVVGNKDLLPTILQIFLTAASIRDKNTHRVAL